MGDGLPKAAGGCLQGQVDRPEADSKFPAPARNPCAAPGADVNFRVIFGNAPFPPGYQHTHSGTSSQERAQPAMISTKVDTGEDRKKALDRKSVV